MPTRSAPTSAPPPRLASMPFRSSLWTAPSARPARSRPRSCWTSCAAPMPSGPRSPWSPTGRRAGPTAAEDLEEHAQDHRQQRDEAHGGDGPEDADRPQVGLRDVTARGPAAAVELGGNGAGGGDRPHADGVVGAEVLRGRGLLAREALAVLVGERRRDLTLQR